MQQGRGAFYLIFLHKRAKFDIRIYSMRSGQTEARAYLAKYVGLCHIIVGPRRRLGRSEVSLFVIDTNSHSVVVSRVVFTAMSPFL